ncbi:MAG: N-acetyltransferase, partial [Propionibacteriaceae bacterium]|nr:N-acetyltransferase [Propionibacteriaceae bacterium]
MGSGGRGSRTRIKKRCEDFSRSNAPTDRPKSPGGRALRHPKPWELEVQSYFRDRGCGRAKKRGTRRLLLARRSGVIVAAADTEVSISKDGDGSYVNFFICAVAINVSERGKGGRLARELVQVLK